MHVGTISGNASNQRNGMICNHTAFPEDLTSIRMPRKE